MLSRVNDLREGDSTKDIVPPQPRFLTCSEKPAIEIRDGEEVQHVVYGGKCIVSLDGDLLRRSLLLPGA